MNKNTPNFQKGDLISIGYNRTWLVLNDFKCANDFECAKGISWKGLIYDFEIRRIRYANVFLKYQDHYEVIGTCDE